MRPSQVPLYAVIGLASAVCGGFMFKYFTGHTEVNWAKSLRGTHDNQGINEKRVASHNSRFGCRHLNKGQITIFPFNFLPFSSALLPSAPLRTTPMTPAGTPRRLNRVHAPPIAGIADKHKFEGYDHTPAE